MRRTMTLRQGGLTAALLIGISFAVPAAAEPEGRVQVVVPVAETLIISGEDEPAERRPVRQPRNPLVLSLPVDSIGAIDRPNSVKDLVQTLRVALPSEYKRRLAMRFGFTRRRDAPQGAPDLRLVDLSAYLFNVFDLGNTDSELGRHIACVSTGGHDLTAIFVNLVAQELEADESIMRRRDVPRDLDVRSIFAVSDRLLFSCGVDP